MPLQNTSGNDTTDAYGGGVAAIPNYIEDVFSTYLYTGTGSPQTITNGIDLSTKGGLVWTKARYYGISHRLVDTVRGPYYELVSNDTSASSYNGQGLTSFGTTGYSIDSGGGYNNSGGTYASWTFRKQPKFFDVVTGTGKGTFTHNLGVVPGCIILKRTSTTGNWIVAHNGLTGGITGTYVCLLNTTDAQSDATVSLSPTATTFSPSAYVGTSDTWVAYFFASNAGGFGLTGTDNVITCGSFTTDSSGNATVNFGYEPQWVMIKRTNDVDNWQMFDVMRGMSQTSYRYLFANSSGAENGFTGNYVFPTATGVSFQNGNLSTSSNFIYIAIRRGPMAVPTDATKVFAPVAYSGTGATRTITTGFPVDLAIPKLRGAAGNSAEWYTRLIGPGVALLSAYAFQELARPTELTSFASNTGVVLGTSSDSGGTNASGFTYVDWNFQRAPSFFDEVCFTGAGSNLTVSHNLQVTPEIIILKYRAGTSYGWKVTSAGLTNPNTYYLGLNNSNAQENSSANFIYNRTSTTFDVSSDLAQSGWNWVGYLFATCAGVSKVGTYTGNGSTQAIACGFTGGARFVLIKRIDSTGDWGVLDTARGMVSGTDPYLNLNTTSAEVNANNVYTTTGGFQLVSSDANFNANGGSYIFLAVA